MYCPRDTDTSTERFADDPVRARLRRRVMKVLGRGMFRPLPGVRGAAVTTQLRNNNRGQIGIAAAGTTHGTTCPPQGGDS
jgi:hypothetical protein